MKRWGHRVAAVVAAAVVVVATAGTPAFAQPQPRPQGDPVAAQALFDAAKRLVHEGRFAEACPKLAESQKLAPAIGTHYALADCSENAGRPATPWAPSLYLTPHPPAHRPRPPA